MGRKICKQCEGKKRIHLPHCDIFRVFDGDCTCDPNKPKGLGGWTPFDPTAGVICPACGGTGERNRSPKVT